MKIQDDYLLVYARKDSQRLKDTFFSDSKEKTKKDNFVLFILIAITIFCTITGIILARYDVFMVKRTQIDMPKNALLILKDKNTILNITSLDLIQKKGSSFYAAIPPKTKAEMKLNFIKPLNLENKSIIFYLKTDETINIETIIKDSRYFSNAIAPIKIEAQKTTNDNYTVASLDFSQYPNNRLNLSHIQQMSFYFYPKDEGARVFIKNIAVTEKSFNN